MLLGHTEIVHCDKYISFLKKNQCCLACTADESEHLYDESEHLYDAPGLTKMPFDNERYFR